jgi:hypothetical protein
MFHLRDAAFSADNETIMLQKNLKQISAKLGSRADGGHARAAATAISQNPG